MTQKERSAYLIGELLKEQPQYRDIAIPQDEQGQKRLLHGLMNVRPPMPIGTEFLAAQDAYLRAFYERFWNGQDVRSGLERYKEKPQEFVDSYAATDIREDFAETFSLFVLGDRPEGDTAAEEKIRFFYDYSELTDRRDFIRENFGLGR